MAIRVKPELIDELTPYGAEDVQNCYHCGNCTAVCPHADDDYVFPRKPMRHLQMGLEEKLERSLEPWLCYYCGQCSEQCPRGAEPGETMMSLRRWLISRYDATGVSRLFFRSTRFELGAILLVAALTALFFLSYGFSRGSLAVYDGPGAFLPSGFIHAFDLGLGALVGLFLAVNAFRFWRRAMGRGAGLKIPWTAYLRKAYLLPWHFFTQKRYADCEKNRRPTLYAPWLFHLGLMLGYATMLVLVMVFVEALQAGPRIRWPVHAFGYAASAGLLAGIVFMLRSRLRKRGTQYMRSHGSDWIFLGLLAVITATGILQHVLHRSGLAAAANVMYVVHLMAVVPWLLRMPFSKWAHLVYRPLAMYFAEVRREALRRRRARLEAAAQAA